MPMRSFGSIHAAGMRALESLATDAKHRDEDTITAGCMALSELGCLPKQLDDALRSGMNIFKYFNNVNVDMERILREIDVDLIYDRASAVDMLRHHMTVGGAVSDETLRAGYAKIFGGVEMCEPIVGPVAQRPVPAVIAAQITDSQSGLGLI